MDNIYDVFHGILPLIVLFLLIGIIILIVVYQNKLRSSRSLMTKDPVTGAYTREGFLRNCSGLFSQQNTQYAVVPKLVLERGCLLPYGGDSFFAGSLAEALGCCIRGYKGFYHTDYTNYVRTDGAKVGGRIAILGGAGPMGIGCVELAMGYAGVSQVVVTDLNQDRLDYAAKMCDPAKAKEKGVDLQFINTGNLEDPVEYLKQISDGGFDDVFVMVPVPALFTMSEKISREDGCINFFAGPPIHDMPGSLNLYRVHYDGIHVVGTAGSIPEDMTDVLDLIKDNKINAGALVSHILGMKAVPETLFAMEKPSGAKKVCYNELDIPLVAIVSRLVAHKGIDIIQLAIEDIPPINNDVNPPNKNDTIIIFNSVIILASFKLYFIFEKKSRILIIKHFLASHIT